jgi:glycosyltransferase involved in cell wall biosynthesis
VGDLKHRELMNILPNFDVYILPTHGENFGHSIFEALSAGLPVIISDQTPWKNLEAQKVGFDIPLDEPNRFVKAIEFFAKCNETEWKEWSINSRQYAKEFYVNQNFEEAYKRLFKLKINVGFVAPITLTRYRGGISVLAEHYLSHKSVLEERGIELHLFNTCTLPRGNESTGKFRWINIKNYIRFVTTSIAKIKEEKTDLLHYNTSVGLSLLKDIVTVRIFKILTNTETILHIHSTDIDELEKENMYRKLFVFFLKRIHRIVVLSDKLRQDLLDLGLESNKVMVIQNYSMLSFKHSISPSQGKINIIFIGSLNLRKGVLDLFEAMQNLPSNLDWHMHVAGDFTSEDFKYQFFSKLEETNLINKVTFHGYVSDKEKKKLFEMSSILVLPSYSEGMPLSILEGLSAGCAILATNVGANKETIKSVANLIHPGDVEAIKYELEKLLINTQYLKNRQKQSLELSRKFSFQKFVDHIAPLYHESIL